MIKASTSGAQHTEVSEIAVLGASFARQIGMLPARDSFADRAMLRLFNAKVRLTRPFRRST